MSIEHIDVVIVGAGISGVSAAWHVQSRCPTKSYAILEARDAMGGTWDLFRYPGVRSDSDMYTLGFRFRPWPGDKSMADGASILAYIEETAAAFGIDDHIRYRHRMVAADWSSEHGRWTLRIDRAGTEATVTCSFLMCTGFYDYDRGYSPDFAGADEFNGPIVHPQRWPQDLDYVGKEIVVIGSGATAVTLVPALADSGARHVTMLQRSPTYILSLPDTDPFAAPLNKVLPARAAYTVLRWKNVMQLTVLFKVCQRWPDRARKVILRLVKRQLPNGYDVEKHFGPSYDPWDQRMCLVPNGDFFRSIRDGNADVVTGTIDHFTPTGIALGSGAELSADIIVTATGFVMQLFGGATFSIDGAPVNVAKSMGYKGTLLSGLPNLSYTTGYTNASWTLKADLESEFVCRLLNYMDENGHDSVEAEHPGATVEEWPWLVGFTPGYALRAADVLPKQGSTSPWRIHQNYIRDVRLIRRGNVTDEGLRFAKHPVAIGSRR